MQDGSNREVSELTDADLWPPNRTSAVTAPVAVVLFHLLARIKSDIKIFHLPCSSEHQGWKKPRFLNKFFRFFRF